MIPALRLTATGPLATIQDAGRPGLLAHGISRSGPMDGAAFARAGAWLGRASAAGVEFTGTLAFVVEAGPLGMAADGADMQLFVDGEARNWPTRLLLQPGATVEVRPGSWGNWGYLRFDHELDLQPVLGSVATNSVAGIGPTALQPGDRLGFKTRLSARPGPHPAASTPASGPIRFIWGLHAEQFPPAMRKRFISEPLRVSARMDRMGIRLDDPAGVFAGFQSLSLVSDAIVPGDIQILGDGTPIVLMRDHQPTGGYPRIGTVISADLDRLAQARPGAALHFQPVTVAAAHRLTTSVQHR